MITGKVIGKVVSTIKNEALHGLKLLMVQIYEDGKPGKLIVAADVVKVSGMGDMVFLVSSKEAAIALGGGMIPIDAGIVGIVDSYNRNA